jgi:hypothetical protein
LSRGRLVDSEFCQSKHSKFYYSSALQSSFVFCIPKPKPTKRGENSQFGKLHVISCE